MTYVHTVLFFQVVLGLQVTLFSPLDPEREGGGREGDGGRGIQRGEGQ